MKRGLFFPTSTLVTDNINRSGSVLCMSEEARHVREFFRRAEVFFLSSRRDGSHFLHYLIFVLPLVDSEDTTILLMLYRDHRYFSHTSVCEYDREWYVYFQGQVYPTSVYSRVEELFDIRVLS